MVRLDVRPFRAPVLVLGSAPKPLVPEWAQGAKVVCVNASGAIARTLDLPNPTLTVMSGFMFGDSVANREARAVLGGLRTQHLVYVDVGCGFSAARRCLRTLGYGWDDVTVLSYDQRAQLVFNVAGVDVSTENTKPSTGVLAVVLALLLKGYPVCIAGFSFQNSGHAYSASMQPRHHVGADVLLLSVLVKNFCLYTTSVDVSECAGIPLWPSAKA